jgi:DnaJ family protein A protein 5
MFIFIFFPSPRRKERERAERAARAAQYQEAAWITNGDGDYSDEDELAEEEQLLLYCVACEKHFKSDAAFANHERSKRHIEKVTLLRAALEEEESAQEEQLESELEDIEEESADEEAGIEAAAAPAAEPAVPPGARISSLDDHASSREDISRLHMPHSMPSAHARLDSSTEEESEGEGGDDDLDEEVLLQRLLLSQRQPRGSSSRDDTDAESDAGPGDDDGGEGEEHEDEAVPRLASSAQRPEGQSAQCRTQRGGGEAGDDDALAQQALQEPAPLTRAATAAAASSDEDGWGPQQGKRGRGKAKAKGGGVKAAGATRPHQAPAGAEQPQQPPQLSTAHSSDRDGGVPGPSAKQKKNQRQAAKREKQGQGGEVEGLACGVCGETFMSRNQLFSHIKSKGHAQVKAGR